MSVEAEILFIFFDQMHLQTWWEPFSSTFISARPSLTRNDRANKFSTVCAKDFLFNIKLSSLTRFILLNIPNIVAIFLSVSVFSSSPAPSSCDTHNRSRLMLTLLKQGRSINLIIQEKKRKKLHQSCSWIINLGIIMKDQTTDTQQRTF